MMSNLRCLSGPFRLLSLWSPDPSQRLYEVPGVYESWHRAQVISELNNNEIWTLLNSQGFYNTEWCCWALAAYGVFWLGEGVPSFPNDSFLAFLLLGGKENSSYLFIFLICLDVYMVFVCFTIHEHQFVPLNKNVCSLWQNQQLQKFR